MVQERNQWMDIAKGITIILMVLGHTSIPDIASRFIWSFHMPLFFIASGWMTNWRKCSGFGEYLTKKAKGILLPFMVYSAIVLLIFECLIGGGILKHWLTHGWEAYALWFIPVLFLASVIGWLVNMCPNKYWRYGMMCVMLVIGCLLSYYHCNLAWTLSSVPFATFLVLLGSELRQQQKWIDEPRWWLMIGSFAIALYISHFWRLDMCFNNILPIMPLTLGAVAGTLMMFTLSSYIVRYTKLLSRVFQAVGRETYVVVAFSQIIIMLLNQYFTLNAALKYGILVIVLVLLVNLKNTINRALKFKLL